MRYLSSTHGEVLEPSGTAAVAAALDPVDWLAGSRVAAVLTGRNVSEQRFRSLVDRMH
jgi:threonine dehydratase